MPRPPKVAHVAKAPVHTINDPYVRKVRARTGKAYEILMAEAKAEYDREMMNPKALLSAFASTPRVQS